MNVILRFTRPCPNTNALGPGLAMMTNRVNSPENLCGNQPQAAWPTSLLPSQLGCEPVRVKSPAPCCNTYRGTLDMPQAKDLVSGLCPRRRAHPLLFERLPVDTCQGGHLRGLVTAHVVSIREVSPCGGAILKFRRVTAVNHIFMSYDFPYASPLLMLLPKITPEKKSRYRHQSSVTTVAKTRCDDKNNKKQTS